MIKPRQTAILCGGLGERLRPLTDTLPKPLAPINGRPFLAFLIDQLLMHSTIKDGTSG